MELEYLKSCLKKRVNLTRLYPQLKGRHDFFNDHLEKVNEGIELLEMAYRLTQKGKDYFNQLGKKFIEMCSEELKNHQNSFSTPFGNAIHESEYELYSVALDAFQND
jgi:hypothetical protein